MKPKVDKVEVDRPGFEEVARRIAGGDPPEWLLIALEHFSPGIGEGPVDVEHLKRQMTDAIDTLLWFLPALEGLGFGLAGEREDVRAVRVLLPGIRKDLERTKRKGTGRVKSKRTGRPPDVGREVCAAVMIEAWKAARGSDAKPHSLEFREACGEYWKACGGGDSGDPENWRRPITAALKIERGWARKIIAGLVENAR
jgi:hypothetical protein